MTNSDDGFDLMADIVRSVAAHYDWGILEPKVYDRHEPSPVTFDRLVGSYGNPDDDLRVVRIDDALFLVGPGGEREALTPVSQDVFLVAESNILYDFLENDDGLISWLRVTLPSGANNDYPRR